MSHATSMCAVAAFLWASATGGQRAAWQWAALGLLGGLMLAIRWQNLVFMAFPAWEIASAFAAAGRAGAAHLRAAGALFGACAFAAFLPQLVAWQAIYGSPIAVSPLSPKMLWLGPDPVRLLWSSRTACSRRRPSCTWPRSAWLVAVRGQGRFGWLAVVVFSLAVYVNASSPTGGAERRTGGGDSTARSRCSSGLAAAIDGLRLARQASAPPCGRCSGCSWCGT